MGFLSRSLDSVGRVAGLPPVWAAAAGAVGVAAGEDGKKAAIRGGLCYAVTGVLTRVVLGRLFSRGIRRPPGPKLAWGQPGAGTAFAVGAAQEVQALALPLVVVVAVSHWPAFRGGRRRVAEAIAGDVLGAGIALWSNQLWPSKHAVVTTRTATPRPGVVRHQGV